MKPLWNYIERKIQLEFGCYVQLDSKSVLLGIIDKKNIRKASLSHINYLILLGKMCISKYRYGAPISIIDMFEMELLLRTSLK